MRIAVASDHEGFEYKEKIKNFLEQQGHHVRDFGTDSTEPCDYPDFVRPAAQSVAAGDCDRAIVLGGSGNGEAIVANKVPGIRCGMVADERVLPLVETWLNTAFQNGRHRRRIDKIEKA